MQQDPPNTETLTPKKLSKRKVRSKQKNIRKDARPLSSKPEHLRLGNPKYAGRPLTTETRQKMKLPPSKTSVHRLLADEHKKNRTVVGDVNNQDAELGKLVVDEETSTSVHFESNNASLVGNKKQKKSKYKNLVNHQD